LVGLVRMGWWEDWVGRATNFGGIKTWIILGRLVIPSLTKKGRWVGAFNS